jgi:hypothetical protein
MDRAFDNGGNHPPVGVQPLADAISAMECATVKVLMTARSARK